MSGALSPLVTMRTTPIPPLWPDPVSVQRENAPKSILVVAPDDDLSAGGETKRAEKYGERDAPERFQSEVFHKPFGSVLSELPSLASRRADAVEASGVTGPVGVGEIN